MQYGVVFPAPTSRGLPFVQQGLRVFTCHERLKC